MCFTLQYQIGNEMSHHTLRITIVCGVCGCWYTLTCRQLFIPLNKRNDMAPFTPALVLSTSLCILRYKQHGVSHERTSQETATFFRYLTPLLCQVPFYLVKNDFRHFPLV